MTARVTQRLGANGALTVVLDQPARKNAINGAMWSELADALQRAADDQAVRVVILTGAAGNFSSGADVSEFGTAREGAAVSAYNAAVARAFSALEACPKPVISAINGICMGAGVALAAFADLRVIAENARLAIPAAKLGVAYQPAWIDRLTRIAGPHLVAQLLFAGETLSGGGASAQGLSGLVVVSAEVEERTRALSEAISNGAPLTMRATKAALRAALGTGDPADAHRLAEVCDQSEDYRNAVLAFAEGRKPTFEGR